MASLSNQKILPGHIGIIMDGIKRWAGERKLPLRVMAKVMKK
jgi:undecaprenyl pyrophosphate synthase